MIGECAHCTWPDRLLYEYLNTSSGYNIEYVCKECFDEIPGDIRGSVDPDGFIYCGNDEDEVMKRTRHFPYERECMPAGQGCACPECEV